MQFKYTSKRTCLLSRVSLRRYYNIQGNLLIYVQNSGSGLTLSLSTRIDETMHQNFKPFKIKWQKY